MKILVINGPNMNMLGLREPDIYGNSTYLDLVRLIETFCTEKGIEVTFFQSNHEGNIIDEIQSAYNNFDGIVINPAAYTHTSIAIADAIKAVGVDSVEVHLSDISMREEYRKISYSSSACIKTIYGKGFSGYIEAVEYLIEYKENAK